MSDLRSHKQVGAQGWRYKTDGQIDHHHNAEVHRVHAHCRHHRQQDWRQDYNRRQGFHESSDNQQQQVDREQNQQGIVSQGQDKIGNCRRDALYR